MANQDPVSVNRVDWLRIIPVLNLWQAIRTGFRVRVLLPTFLALSLFSAGARWFQTTPVPDAAENASGLMSQTALDQWWTNSFGASFLPPPLNAVVDKAGELLATASNPGLHDFAALLGSTILLTFLGIAIARSTATEFCSRKKTGAIAAIKFSLQHFTSGLLSLSLSAGIVAGLLCSVRFTGWLAGIEVFGLWFAYLCQPIVFLLATVTAVAACVCGTAWILSLGAIGTDQCSGSDALSRGINYVLSHKLYTVFILGVASVTSAAAAALMRFLLYCGTVVSGVGLTSRANTAFETTRPLTSDMWKTVIQILPDAVQLGAFLAATTLAYILLRHAEDAVRTDELDAAA